MNTKLIYDTVSERDMDMLFANALSTDPNFLQLFLDRLKIGSSDYVVESVELSKTDAKLGESDLTAIISNGENKIGLLIEDKIDAKAMPEQHKRYQDRGDKGVDEKIYDDYEIFMLCPSKYYKQNDEAKHYDNYISYETCLEYFEKSSSVMASVWIQQIKNAIKKAKKPSTTIVDEKKNVFFNKYLEYQKNNYPRLTCFTDSGSNGTWAKYYSADAGVYLIHKIPQGEVELVFNGIADDFDRMQIIADWLGNNNYKGVRAEPTGKSCVLKFDVPKFNMEIDNAFEKASKSNLAKCFEKIIKLLDFICIVKMTKDLIDSTKKRYRIEK